LAYGIEIFKDHFSKYTEQYTIIGGMACDLLMTEAELDFRQTRDIDMVLIVEALTNEFAAEFWQFIKEGGYEAWTRKDGCPMFYRFMNPTASGYPYMIELFSRPENIIAFSDKSHLIPLHIDDEISSLSAILLNEDYYKFLLQGMTVTKNISVLDALHIIPLKMRAWIDLLDQKKAGVHVNEKDIRKHRQDVFRLFPLVNPEARVVAPGQVYKDIIHFISIMRENDVDLKAIHVQRDKDSILDVYEAIYIQTP
jgi:hypothetical protein